MRLSTLANFRGLVNGQARLDNLLNTPRKLAGNKDGRLLSPQQRASAPDLQALLSASRARAAASPDSLAVAGQSSRARAELSAVELCLRPPAATRPAIWAPPSPALDAALGPASAHQQRHHQQQQQRPAPTHARVRSRGGPDPRLLSPATLSRASSKLVQRAASKVPSV
jgi:hypothetical protein